MRNSSNETWGSRKGVVEVEPTQYPLLLLFYIGVKQSPPLPSGEAAIVTVGLLQSSIKSDRKFVETTCLLRPSIVKYEVSIDGNSVSLSQKPSQGEVVSLANNTNFWNETSDRTLLAMSGITDDMTMPTQANASVLSPPGGNWDIDYTGYEN